MRFASGFHVLLRMILRTLIPWLFIWCYNRAKLLIYLKPAKLMTFPSASAVLVYLYLPQITSTNKVFLSPVFICWLVCQQDFTKTAEQISIKLGWRLGLCPEWNPLTFGLHLDK